MRTSERGKNLIKSYEGCRLTAYYCPSGVLTIGYGHTGNVYVGQTITQEEADVLFDNDLIRYEKPVQAYSGLNQNQFDALVSFTYNCGQGALDDVMSSGNVTKTMEMYHHGNGGVDLVGLIKRRKEEVALYNTPVVNETYLNLHPHNETWRVYRLGVSAIVGNECGKLAPKKYNGLSYKIIEDKGDIKIIETQSFGRVQIYAPRDRDSSITNNPIY